MTSRLSSPSAVSDKAFLANILAEDGQPNSEDASSNHTLLMLRGIDEFSSSDSDLPPGLDSSSDLEDGLVGIFGLNDSSSSDTGKPPKLLDSSSSDADSSSSDTDKPPKLGLDSSSSDADSSSSDTDCVDSLSRKFQTTKARGNKSNYKITKARARVQISSACW